MTDENEAEAHGPPTPLEILSTNLHLHRSVMDLLMQGPWHMMSPMLVQQYLRRSPDMAARVDAWRPAGQQELARRKEQRLVVWREEQRIAREQQEQKRRAEARRLALSHSRTSRGSPCASAWISASPSGCWLLPHRSRMR